MTSVLPGLVSADPATGETIETFTPMPDREVSQVLADSARVFASWRDRGIDGRAEVLLRAAALLREQRGQHARLITREMGKPVTEAEAEIDKCAWVCEYYAANAGRFLADQPAPSDSGGSFIAFAPIGPVLAVMPWNYPFWQVFRFLAPALMAGNTALLKHAANVTRCALTIEAVLHEAGLPAAAFRTLPIGAGQVRRVIADPAVRAVTVTGSERAGSAVAATAGEFIKKTVLELGGSDAFIVLADCDVSAAAATAAQARFQNCGQSCIAAKRFIVMEQVADQFEAELAAAAGRLTIGDPGLRSTTIGPLARADLRDTLEDQLSRSLAGGSRLVAGGSRPDRPGWYFRPAVITCTDPAAAALREETFGPLAAVIRVRSEDEAIRLANDSDFGLGGALWTGDAERGVMLARRLDTGGVFINGMTHSDPRLPFGGVKRSGYGRELHEFGIREFVNTQTIWLADNPLR